MDEAYAAEAFPEAGYPLIKSVQGKQIDSDVQQAGVNFRIFGIYGKFEDFLGDLLLAMFTRLLLGSYV